MHKANLLWLAALCALIASPVRAEVTLVLSQDHLADQALERGGILNLLARLAEDLFEHFRPPAEFFEDVAVLYFEFIAVLVDKARPA